MSICRGIMILINTKNQLFHLKNDKIFQTAKLFEKGIDNVA